MLDQQVVEWYANVPAAAHLEGADVDSEYYKRNLIETAWRIRMLRVAEAKALVEIADRDPERLQLLGLQLHVHVLDEVG
ncbi:hypothetical protein K7G98_39190, partial [Saccharothrix sp. MB29]|nr:hypothetical protein [Saccharothrix sp. MB29]